MELVMKIKNIKGINEFDFSFPLDKGIYAITGENGSGKSTLISCASTVFYSMPMYEHFGRPKDAVIEFDIDGATRSWHYDGKKWEQENSDKKMKINGFYEGSIIFGNRFKDTKMSVINLLDSFTEKDTYPAREFVVNNLGLILHNNVNYYKELFVVKKSAAEQKGLSHATYFYKTAKGEFVSQPRMSTGENLLLSILNSLEILRKKRLEHNDGRPCIVFLDEIELALHSSALRRLILFLKEVADEINLSIFFSTHSLELLREIKAQNIYYLTKMFDGSIVVTNPCYPAYATRNLYGDDGYGNDMVVLVEDDLAKLIIEKIMVSKNIARSIRIKILPTGGWTNTITMAYDVTSSNLLHRGTKLAVVLDRDIKGSVPEFISNHKQYSGIKIDFLPIASLEKYLKLHLVDKVDNQLFVMLDTYLFQKRPLNEIIREYVRTNTKDDSDGKAFYGFLLNEIKSMRKDREDIVDIVVRYILENEEEKINELSSYLVKKIDE